MIVLEGGHGYDWMMELHDIEELEFVVAWTSSLFISDPQMIKFCVTCAFPNLFQNVL